MPPELQQPFLTSISVLGGIIIGIFIGSIIESTRIDPLKSTTVIKPRLEISCEGTKCDTTFIYKIKQQ